MIDYPSPAPGTITTSGIGSSSCGCHQGAWHSILPPPRCSQHGGSEQPVTSSTSGTGLSLYGQCQCFYVGDFPPRCPVHNPEHGLNFAPAPLMYTVQAPAPSLSDADVERIARRVAELIRAAP